MSYCVNCGVELDSTAQKCALCDTPVYNPSQKEEKNVHTPPVGHFGDSELEIGRVCVQLASPDFKYMTGETLTLEGGMGQRP